MQPSILTKILPKTEEKADYFLALEIQDDKIKTAACESKEGEVRVLGFGTSDYSGSWEEATLAADQALAQVEDKFPQEIEVNKVILGLPTEYTKDGQIETARLISLKELLGKLSLTPFGFVEISLAIIHFLQQQEGGPQTLILVRTGRELTVSLVRVGKITHNLTVPRTDNLALDLEKALATFTGVEVLPSSILLYDGQDLEKSKQELMNHPWLTQAPFLHFPKIETAPADLDIKAITFAAAKQTAQKLEIIADKEEVDLGFVKGEDILEKKEQPETVIKPPLETPEASLQFNLPRFDLPKLPSIQNLRILLAQKIGLAILLGVLSLVLLGGGIIFVSWYLPTAQVNLMLESQTLQQTMEISLNPKITAVEQTVKEVPALIIEIDEKETKKAATSGKKLVGESAKGEVTIYNKTTNAKTFKKGTILLSPNNLKFSLEDDVTIASASEGVDYTITPGKQNSKVTASAIGPEGNLGVGQEFRFADLPATSYVAKNNVAFSGGTSREISVVARADQEKLLSSTSTELTEKAKTDLAAKLGAGEKIIDKTITGIVSQKKFDKEVDEEATEISLEMVMHFSASGFKEDNLLLLLEKTVISSVPAGYEFRRSEVKMDVLESQKKKDGTLVLKINFAATLLPKINQEEIKKNLLGKSLTEAEKYLRSLGNIAGYEIKFGRQSPFFKNILPRLSQNISLETSSRK